MLKTTSEVADLLGRSEMARRLEVVPGAVSNAIGRGVFPAWWRPVLETWVAELGEEIADGVFRTRHRNTRHVKNYAPSGEAAQSVQKV